MDTVKSGVLESLNVEQNSLNEIELEDVQLEPVVQKNIYKTKSAGF